MPLEYTVTILAGTRGRLGRKVMVEQPLDAGALEREAAEGWGGKRAGASGRLGIRAAKEKSGLVPFSHP
jgi:hypothetical protein